MDDDMPSYGEAGNLCVVKSKTGECDPTDCCCPCSDSAVMAVQRSFNLLYFSGNFCGQCPWSHLSDGVTLKAVPNMPQGFFFGFYSAALSSYNMTDNSTVAIVGDESKFWINFLDKPQCTLRARHRLFVPVRERVYFGLFIGFCICFGLLLAFMGWYCTFTNGCAVYCNRSHYEQIIDEA
eukprot:TRINITY_DN9058_c0_g1_i1.p1 TRINITY_DN9058_c0_g1~~TRINITY_DN9058_c0_g1_i1.p1  ORF type:complete len:208 (+),score=19.91 TRINITY_DN9058_c0_g1_i1:86-625(+)